MFQSLLKALSRALLLGSTLAAATLCNQAQAQKFDPAHFGDTPYVLTNGVAGKPVHFESHSPLDYSNVIAHDDGPSVTLTGQLFLPANASGPVRVVIIDPGSGNLAPNYFEHAAALTSAGIAAFAIDPFTGRGVINTIADQNQFSFAASAFDVLAAAKYLRTLPQIDGAHIGSTGGSRGGTAVMMASAAPMSDAVLGSGHGLSAIVAGYPYCGVQFRSARLSANTSLLIMSGDSDNWVSPLQCEDAAHAMDVGGQNVVMELIPGAFHSFDRAGVPPTTFPDAVKSLRFPTVYMSDSGQYYSLRTGRVDPTLTSAILTGYAVKGGFIDKGATIGSSGTQAAEYESELVQFFKAKL